MYCTKFKKTHMLDSNVFDLRLFDIAMILITENLHRHVSMKHNINLEESENHRKTTSWNSLIINNIFSKSNMLKMLDKMKGSAGKEVSVKFDMLSKRGN